MNVSASLIVTIVRKGWGSSVLQASVKAGARGGTVLLGRGAGVHEHEKIFGMSIEPEKEIVLTIVQSEQVEAILGEIRRAAELNEAGRGMAFVVPVHQIVGVADSMLLGACGTVMGLRPEPLCATVATRAPDHRSRRKSP